MVDPLRLLSLRLTPEDLGAIRGAVEAGGGQVTLRSVDRPVDLFGIDPDDVDVIVAVHRAVDGYDARSWLPMRPVANRHPVILLCEEIDLVQVDQLRQLGAFAVVPRGHPVCLIQTIRQAINPAALSAVLNRPPNGLQEPSLEDRRFSGLLRVIGHNLRDLLGVITNAVEVISFQSAPDSLSQKRAIALLDYQCRRMAGLLDDYSEINRIGSGVSTTTTKVVELGGVVTRAISRTLLETDHRIEIDRSSQSGPVWLQLDPKRLEHLIRHCLHFCRRSAIGCQAIRVDWQRSEDRVNLILTPTPRVMELVPPGSGQAIDFDLFLASILVDRLGGMLRLGPPFVIELPNVVSTDVENRDETIAAESFSAQGRNRSNRHLVLVDDNLHSVQALGLLMGRLGWHVQTTPDFHEAMSIIQTRQPEVVLIGLQTAVLDGESLAMNIRRALPRGSPLLIGISDSTSDPGTDLKGRSPFDHILTKPVRLAELTALLGSPKTQAQSG